MRLPEALEAAIAEVTERIPFADLQRASFDLSRQYSAAEFTNSALRTNAHRAAYLLTRMPATFAACSHVLGGLRERDAQAEINSLLDLGAGPGTASWAALEIFPSIMNLALVERDERMVELGKLMAVRHGNEALQSAQWTADYVSHKSTPETSCDLVVASYLLGELDVSAQAAMVHLAWRRARRYMVLIEPGTPRGYQTLLRVRTALLEEGANLVAPCPHAGTCPLAGTPEDWCHFAQRMERSSLHRKLKGGSLSYEDEKFSYMIFSRDPVERAASRILRHPVFNKGHVKLTLCAQQGLENRVVTKSQGEIYKRARKSEWCDAWEE